MQFIPYGHQCVDEEDVRAVVEILHGDWLTTGPTVSTFEEGICAYIGCKHAVAVNSGTSALDIAVQALDLPRGSEVVTTPLTFAATSNALLYNNLIPVFADIKRDTRNIDPDEIRRKITSRTKAIIYVDYAGHPCEIDEIKEIAEEHDLILIEDACHAFGASYHGKKIGTMADMTIFSFHPVKPITTGEGGAVVTDDPELAARLKLLRSHGITRNIKDMFGEGSEWAYDMVDLGRNYRMTDIQAALGISQLKKIDAFIKRRNDLAKVYEELIGDLPWLETPQCHGDVIHGWHLYTVLLNDIKRNDLYRYLHQNNVGANVHYIPIYRFTYYQKHFPIDPRTLPVAEDVFDRIITLPLYPSMENRGLDYVSDTLKKAGSTL